MKANEIEKIVKAAMEAMEKYGGDIGFMESMKRFNLGEEKLELWLTAYEESGLSGIRALVETFPVGQDKIREATRQIHDFFRVGWPDWKYKISRRYNIFTISVQPTSREDFLEICQLRYTPFDDRWHLFWKRTSGKWSPYVPDTADTEGQLWKALYLLKLDDFGCFFE